MFPEIVLVGQSGVSPGKIARRENVRVANACFAFLCNPGSRLVFEIAINGDLDFADVF
jgi:hypothetical protein